MNSFCWCSLLHSFTLFTKQSSFLGEEKCSFRTLSSLKRFPLTLKKQKFHKLTMHLILKKKQFEEETHQKRKPSPRQEQNRRDWQFESRWFFLVVRKDNTPWEFWQLPVHLQMSRTVTFHPRNIRPYDYNQISSVCCEFNLKLKWTLCLSFSRFLSQVFLVPIFSRISIDVFFIDNKRHQSLFCVLFFKQIFSLFPLNSSWKEDIHSYKSKWNDVCVI